MIPPSFITVRVQWAVIPLPIFLLWPFLALGWIVLGIAFSVLLLVSGSNAAAIGRLWVESWRLICAFSGTRVDVETQDARMKVRIV
jgi:hypothetical protein